MYEVGTLVLYDKRGVYRIESMGAPPVWEISGDYYRLCAVFSNSKEIIYTPADTVSSMRPLISGSEAAHYLELFSQLEPHVFHSGKPMDLTAYYQKYACLPQGGGLPAFNQGNPYQTKGDGPAKETAGTEGHPVFEAGRKIDLRGICCCFGYHTRFDQGALIRRHGV